jgi:hypothetical protein
VHLSLTIFGLVLVGALRVSAALLVMRCWRGWRAVICFMIQLIVIGIMVRGYPKNSEVRCFGCFVYETTLRMSAAVQRIFGIKQ